ncbi:MAG: putative oxidoreductase, aryl-alcohol dehydrogenase like protein [Mycobacterium sp.]|jgi:aryl-alcohol dehydrogenase-like predicted oxidoreductase|nr:putative oxidoreductase, aryl-alcohol dehydrogenase like protein [Mycobacterium sp.]
MRQARLGRSGLVVSRLAFGTWQLGGDWGPTDTAAALDAIRRAADAGVTLFDTAQAYGFGQSEQLLSAALSGVPRDQFVIASKGGLRPTDAGLVRDASARWIREGVDASLRALGTDYIDLYQLHWPDPATRFDETAEALAGLIAAGKIRHVGVSNFDVGQMETFEVTLPIETIQPPYDLFGRHIAAEVLPYAAQHDIGVLVSGPLAHGLLTGSLGPDTRFARDDWRSRSPMFQGETYARNLRVAAVLGALATELGFTLPQLAISWTLTNPEVDVAIVGTRNSDHVDEAVAASMIDLDDEVIQRIDNLVVDAVPIAGPSPETL